MNERLDWSDLEIFYHVAENGGLSAAGRKLDLSPPTVGRRILALEQRFGLSLFHRAQTGYSLTQTGKALLEKVRVMQAAALPVQEILSSDTEAPLIRLSTGTATASFLVDKFNLLHRPGDRFRVTFVTTEAVLDIAHREIDLGIRNRPADSGNLASRRLGILRFAAYRSWTVPDTGSLGWVAVDPSQAKHPAARWLHEQAYSINAMASSVATVHELVRAGAGIGVMPCMIGDIDPALCRAGPIIEELTENQYLTMHNDDRHRPPVRRLIERIIKIYDDNLELLAGHRPLRGE